MGSNRLDERGMVLNGVAFPDYFRDIGDAFHARFLQSPNRAIESENRQKSDLDRRTVPGNAGWTRSESIAEHGRNGRARTESLCGHPSSARRGRPFVNSVQSPYVTRFSMEREA